MSAPSGRQPTELRSDAVMARCIAVLGRSPIRDKAIRRRNCMVEGWKRKGGQLNEWHQANAIPCIHCNLRPYRQMSTLPVLPSCRGSIEALGLRAKARPGRIKTEILVETATYELSSRWFLNGHLQSGLARPPRASRVGR
jgi:hypothetical protein